MKKYLSFCKKFNTVMMFLGVLMLGFAVVLTFVQVITRNIASVSFSWAEETTRYVVIFAVYLASGYVFYIDGNASVDILYNLFPKKVQCILTFVFYLLIAGFLVVMGYYGYVCVARNLNTWCASIRIPWAVPFSSLILGSVNMFLQLPAKMYLNYQRLAAGE